MQIREDVIKVFRLQTLSLTQTVQTLKKLLCERVKVCLVKDCTSFTCKPRDVNIKKTL